MQVYIEYLLIDNLVIDFLLLKATASLTKTEVKGGRLFLSSLFGALVALIYPLVENKSKILSTVIKIFCALTMIVIAFKREGFRGYYIKVVAFFLLSFLAGGMIFGVFSIFNIPMGKEICVALVIFPAYLAIKSLSNILKYFIRRAQAEQEIKKITLILGDAKIEERGFYDTGNALYEGDNPVIVCDYYVAKKLICNSKKRIKTRRILLRTIAGENENIVFTLDQLRIYNGDKENIYYNVSACVSTSSVGDGYGVILHPALIGGELNGQTANETKKIS